MDPIPGLDKAINDFVAARGTDEKMPVVSRPDLTKQINSLSQAYWDRTTQILTDLAKRSADQLVFNKYERMVVDVGLLDPRLVPDLGESRAELLKELYARVDSHHFYFSEWLSHRYRTFALTGRMEAAAPMAAEAPTVAPGEDSETAQYKLARKRLYAALRPLFDNLPGFPVQTVEMLFSGQMDITIDDLAMQLARREDPRTADQRKHLMTMRQRMIARARERAAGDEQLTFFDGLTKIDSILESKVRKMIETTRDQRKETQIKAKPVSRVVDKDDPAERIKFLKGELTLVKSLLRLGVMGSGVTRTTPVLFSTKMRTRKSELTRGLETVKECDPALPGSPNMLVAPYIGTGFYEWDRDTVFVPLSPTRGVEEAVVTALANYRFMLDNLQGKGSLKRAYEIKFDKEDFRTGFIRDYKNWVLGVGKGFKGTMSQEAYDFFKEHIGPNANDLFAPAELARISPEQRTEVIKQARGKLNRAEGTHEDHYALAVLYWKENRLQEALENVAAAVKLYPVDGRILYALGHLCVAVGYNDKAKDAFNEVLNIAPNTIWHIYASDALQKLL